MALFAIPVYFFQAYGLRLLGKSATALLGMVAKIAVMGGVLYFLFQWDSMVLNILFVLLSVAVTALVVCTKARLSLTHHYVPLLSGVAVAVLVAGAWLLVAVMGGADALATPRMVPVAALLCGAVLETEAKAMTYYYMGLRNHGDMYYYMLGNGATRGKALFYFRKRALERVATHCMRNVGGMMCAATPFVMWAMLLGGASVLTACGMQVAVAVAMWTASMLSVAVALMVATRYSIDGYGRLKDNTAADAASGPDSDSSAPTAAEAEAPGIVAETQE